MNRRFLSRSLAALLSVLMALEAPAADAAESLWNARRHAVQLASAAPVPALPSLLPTAIPPAAEAASRAPGAESDLLSSVVAALPADAGRVEVAGGPAPRAVAVLIEDIHGNEEAQRRIAGAVGALIDAKLAGAIGLEGAATTIDLERFRRFPDRAATAAAADYFLRANALSGAAFAAVTADRPLPPIVGLEDAALYDANVSVVRRANGRRADALRALDARIADVDARKRAIFPPALAALDGVASGYRRGAVDLGDYLRALAAAAPAPASIARFLTALEIERRLSFPTVERERRALLDALAPRLSRAEMDDLARVAVAYRVGRVTHAGFYDRLERLAAGHGLDPNRYPAMRDYTRYVDLTGAVDADALIADAADLERRAFDARRASPAERALLDESRALDLERKLITFSLTSTEWTTWRRLARNDGPAPFEDFYRDADRRTDAMSARFLTALGRNGARCGVLVAGGFHAGDLRDRLLKAGVACVTFVPRVTQVETAGGTRYLSAFAREKTDLERLFEGERLFLAPPPVSRVLVQRLPATQDALAYLNGTLTPRALRRAYADERGGRGVLTRWRRAGPNEAIVTTDERTTGGEDVVVTDVRRAADGRRVDAVTSKIGRKPVGRLVLDLSRSIGAWLGLGRDSYATEVGVASIAEGLFFQHVLPGFLARHAVVTKEMREIGQPMIWHFAFAGLLIATLSSTLAAAFGLPAPTWMFAVAPLFGFWLGGIAGHARYNHLARRNGWKTLTIPDVGRVTGLLASRLLRRRETWNDVSLTVRGETAVVHHRATGFVDIYRYASLQWTRVVTTRDPSSRIAVSDDGHVVVISERHRSSQYRRMTPEQQLAHVLSEGGVRPRLRGWRFDGNRIRTFEVQNGTDRVDLSANGNELLATGGNITAVFRIDAAGQAHPLWEGRGRGQLSRDGRRLVVHDTPTSTATAYDLTADPPTRLGNPFQRIGDIRLAADGSSLVTMSLPDEAGDGVVRFYWDFGRGTYEEIGDPMPDVIRMTSHPAEHGQIVLATTYNGEVLTRVRDGEATSFRDPFGEHEVLEDTRISLNGRIAAALYSDIEDSELEHQIALYHWDGDAYRPLGRRISGVSFGSYGNAEDVFDLGIDGRTLVALMSDGSAEIYRIEGDAMHRLGHFDGPFIGVRISPEGGIAYLRTEEDETEIRVGVSDALPRGQGTAFLRPAAHDFLWRIVVLAAKAMAYPTGAPLDVFDRLVVGGEPLSLSNASHLDELRDLFMGTAILGLEHDALRLRDAMWNDPSSPMALRVSRSIGAWLGLGRDSYATEVGVASFLEGGLGLHFLPWFLGWHGTVTKEMREIGQPMIWHVAFVGLIAGTLASLLASYLGLPAPNWIFAVAPLFGFWLGGIVGHARYNHLARRPENRWRRLVLSWVDTDDLDLNPSDVEFLKDLVAYGFSAQETLDDYKDINGSVSPWQAQQELKALYLEIRNQIEMLDGVPRAELQQALSVLQQAIALPVQVGIDDLVVGPPEKQALLEASAHDGPPEDLLRRLQRTLNAGSLRKAWRLVIRLNRFVHAEVGRNAMTADLRNAVERLDKLEALAPPMEPEDVELTADEQGAVNLVNAMDPNPLFTLDRLRAHWNMTTVLQARWRLNALSEKLTRATEGETLAPELRATMDRLARVGATVVEATLDDVAADTRTDRDVPHWLRGSVRMWARSARRGEPVTLDAIKSWVGRPDLPDDRARSIAAQIRDVALRMIGSHRPSPFLVLALDRLALLSERADGRKRAGPSLQRRRDLKERIRRGTMALEGSRDLGEWLGLGRDSYATEVGVASIAEGFFFQHFLPGFLARHPVVTKEMREIGQPMIWHFAFVGLLAATLASTFAAAFGLPAPTWMFAVAPLFGFWLGGIVGHARYNHLARMPENRWATLTLPDGGRLASLVRIVEGLGSQVRTYFHTATVRGRTLVLRRSDETLAIHRASMDGWPVVQARARVVAPFEISTDGNVIVAGQPWRNGAAIRGWRFDADNNVHGLSSLRTVHDGIVLLSANGRTMVAETGENEASVYQIGPTGRRRIGSVLFPQHGVGTISDDGRRILIAEDGVADPTSQLYGVSESRLHAIGAPLASLHVSLSADGTVLVALLNEPHGGPDGAPRFVVRFYAIDDDGYREIGAPLQDVTVVRTFPADSGMVVASQIGPFRVDITRVTATGVQTLHQPFERAYRVKMSLNGRIAAAATPFMNEVRLYRWTGNRYEPLGSAIPVSQVDQGWGFSLSHDGRAFAVIAPNGDGHVFRVESGDVRLLRTIPGPLRIIRVSPEGGRTAGLRLNGSSFAVSAAAGPETTSVPLMLHDHIWRTMVLSAKAMISPPTNMVFDSLDRFVTGDVPFSFASEHDVEYLRDVFMSFHLFGLFEEAQRLRDDLFAETRGTMALDGSRDLGEWLGLGRDSYATEVGVASITEGLFFQHVLPGFLARHPVVTKEMREIGQPMIWNFAVVGLLAATLASTLGAVFGLPAPAWMFAVAPLFGFWLGGIAGHARYNHLARRTENRWDRLATGDKGKKGRKPGSRKKDAQTPAPAPTPRAPADWRENVDVVRTANGELGVVLAHQEDEAGEPEIVVRFFSGKYIHSETFSPGEAARDLTYAGTVADVMARQEEASAGTSEPTEKPKKKPAGRRRPAAASSGPNVNDPAFTEEALTALLSAVPELQTLPADVRAALAREIILDRDEVDGPFADAADLQRRLSGMVLHVEDAHVAAAAGALSYGPRPLALPWTRAAIARLARLADRALGRAPRVDPTAIDSAAREIAEDTTAAGTPADVQTRIAALAGATLAWFRLLGDLRVLPREKGTTVSLLNGLGLLPAQEGIRLLGVDSYPQIAHLPTDQMVDIVQQAIGRPLDKDRISSRFAGTVPADLSEPEDLVELLRTKLAGDQAPSAVLLKNAEEWFVHYDMKDDDLASRESSAEMYRWYLARFLVAFREIWPDRPVVVMEDSAVDALRTAPLLESLGYVNVLPRLLPDAAIVDVRTASARYRDVANDAKYAPTTFGLKVTGVGRTYVFVRKDAAPAYIAAHTARHSWVADVLAIPILEGGLGLHFLPWFLGWHGTVTKEMREIGMPMIWRFALVGLVAATLASVLGSVFGLPAPPWMFAVAPLFGFWLGGIAGHARYNAIARRNGWARLTVPDFGRLDLLQRLFRSQQWPEEDQVTVRGRTAVIVHRPYSGHESWRVSIYRAEPLAWRHIASYGSAHLRGLSDDGNVVAVYQDSKEPSVQGWRFGPNDGGTPLDPVPASPSGAVILSGDGRTLVIQMNGGDARVYHIGASGIDQIGTVRFPTRGEGMLSRDGRRLLVYGPDAWTAVLYDVAGGAPRLLGEPLSSAVRPALAEDGSVFAAVGEDPNRPRHFVLRFYAIDDDGHREIGESIESGASVRRPRAILNVGAESGAVIVSQRPPFVVSRVTADRVVSLHAPFGPEAQTLDMSRGGRIAAVAFPAGAGLAGEAIFLYHWTGAGYAPFGEPIRAGPGGPFHLSHDGRTLTLISPDGTEGRVYRIESGGARLLRAEENALLTGVSLDGGRITVAAHRHGTRFVSAAAGPEAASVPLALHDYFWRVMVLAAKAMRTVTEGMSLDRLDRFVIGDGPFSFESSSDLEPLRDLFMGLHIFGLSDEAQRLRDSISAETRGTMALDGSRDLGEWLGLGRDSYATEVGVASVAEGFFFQHFLPGFLARHKVVTKEMREIGVPMIWHFAFVGLLAATLASTFAAAFGLPAPTWIFTVAPLLGFWLGGIAGHARYNHLARKPENRWDRLATGDKGKKGRKPGSRKKDAQTPAPAPRAPADWRENIDVVRAANGELGVVLAHQEDEAGEPEIVVRFFSGKYIHSETFSPGEAARDLTYAGTVTDVMARQEEASAETAEPAAKPKKKPAAQRRPAVASSGPNVNDPAFTEEALATLLSTVPELQALASDVRAVLAHEIIYDRNEIGPFSDANDLQQRLSGMVLDVEDAHLAAAAVALSFAPAPLALDGSRDLGAWLGLGRDSYATEVGVASVAEGFFFQHFLPGFLGRHPVVTKEMREIGQPMIWNFAFVGLIAGTLASLLASYLGLPAPNWIFAVAPLFGFWLGGIAGHARYNHLARRPENRWARLTLPDYGRLRNLTDLPLRREREGETWSDIELIVRGATALVRHLEDQTVGVYRASGSTWRTIARRTSTIQERLSDNGTVVLLQQTRGFESSTARGWRFGHDDRVRTISPFPVGSVPLSENGRVTLGEADDEVRIYVIGPNGKRRMGTIPSLDPSAFLSADGHRLLIENEQNADLYDLSGAQPRRIAAVPGHFFMLSRDGGVIATITNADAHGGVLRFYAVAADGASLYAIGQPMAFAGPMENIPAQAGLINMLDDAAGVTLVRAAAGDLLTLRRAFGPARLGDVKLSLDGRIAAVTVPSRDGRSRHIVLYRWTGTAYAPFGEPIPMATDARLGEPNQRWSLFDLSRDGRTLGVVAPDAGRVYRIEPTGARLVRSVPGAVLQAHFIADDGVVSFFPRGGTTGIGVAAGPEETTLPLPFHAYFWRTMVLAAKTMMFEPSGMPLDMLDRHVIGDEPFSFSSADDLDCLRDVFMSLASFGLFEEAERLRDAIAAEMRGALALDGSRDLGEWLGLGRDSYATEVGVAAVAEGFFFQHFLPGFLGRHPVVTKEMREIGQPMIWNFAFVGLLAATVASVLASLFGLPAPAWMFAVAPLFGFWLGGIVGHARYNHLARKPENRWGRLTLGRETEEQRLGRALVNFALGYEDGRALDALAGPVVQFHADAARENGGFVSADGIDFSRVDAAALRADIVADLAARGNRAGVKDPAVARAAVRIFWMLGLRANAGVSGAAPATDAQALPDGNLLFPTVDALETALPRAPADRNPVLYVLAAPGDAARLEALKRDTGRDIRPLVGDGFADGGRLDFTRINAALGQLSEADLDGLTFVLDGADIEALMAVLAALPDGAALRRVRYLALDRLLDFALPLRAKDLIEMNAQAAALVSKQA